MRNLGILGALVLASAARAEWVQVGEKTAKIYVGKVVIGTAGPGTIFEMKSLKDTWVGVQWKNRNLTINGWIKVKDCLRFNPLVAEMIYDGDLATVDPNLEIDEEMPEQDCYSSPNGPVGIQVFKTQGHICALWCTVNLPLAFSKTQLTNCLQSVISTAHLCDDWDGSQDQAIVWGLRQLIAKAALADPLEFSAYEDHDTPSELGSQIAVMNNKPDGYCVWGSFYTLTRKEYAKGLTATLAVIKLMNTPQKPKSPWSRPVTTEDGQKSLSDLYYDQIIR